MSVFSDAEIAYLGSQQLGRLATVGRAGLPHVVPVAFRYNPEAGTIDIGGHDFATRKKVRDVKRTGVAALVVDDVLPPWQPRAVEVRGGATTLDTGGKAIMEGVDDRSSGSHLAGSSPGAWRTASRLARWADPNPTARSVDQAQPHRDAAWTQLRSVSCCPSARDVSILGSVCTRVRESCAFPPGATIQVTDHLRAASSAPARPTSPCDTAAAGS
jgi:pyridoxamine 5'-phosphate oxidase family protein